MISVLVAYQVRANVSYTREGNDEAYKRKISEEMVE